MKARKIDWMMVLLSVAIVSMLFAVAGCQAIAGAGRDITNWSEGYVERAYQNQQQRED